jgi:hypothetical protein
MTSFELTGTVTALANIITHKLTAEEFALASSLFVQFGDTLATTAARESFCENKNT